MIHYSKSVSDISSSILCKQQGSERPWKTWKKCLFWENSGEKIENWNDSGKTQGIFFTGINYTKLNLHNLFLCFFVVV